MLGSGVAISRHDSGRAGPHMREWAGLCRLLYMTSLCSSFTHACDNEMRFVLTLLAVVVAATQCFLDGALPPLEDVLRQLRDTEHDTRAQIRRAERASQVQLHQRHPLHLTGNGDDRVEALRRQVRFRHVAATFEHPSRQSARVAVDNSMSDNEFLIRLGVGTPPQYSWAQFDTGSPDTWLYSHACCFRSNHSYFDPTLSRSFATHVVVAGASPLFTISYADQSIVTANLSFDTFTFDRQDVGTTKPTPAEQRHSAIAAHNQPFGLVHNVSDAARAAFKGDALMGLSPGSNASSGMRTPFETMILSRTLAAPLLSITLVKTSEVQSGAAQFAGRITLGEVDEAARLGALAWFNSTSTVYWGAWLDGAGAMRMGDVDLYANGTKPARFIVDTGSAVIYLPPSLATLAHAHIEGAARTNESGNWVVPCSIANTSSTNARDIKQPLFSVRIGGRRFAVPPEDMVMYPDHPFATDSDTGRKLCLSGIQDGEDQFAVLGNTFIKNHLVVLKYVDGALDKRQLGIAWRRDTGIIVDDAGKPIARIGSRGHVRKA